jgi:hypothetical protein
VVHHQQIPKYTTEIFETMGCDGGVMNNTDINGGVYVRLLNYR